MSRQSIEHLLQSSVYERIFTRYINDWYRSYVRIRNRCRLMSFRQRKPFVSWQCRRTALSTNRGFRWQSRLPGCYLRSCSTWIGFYPRSPSVGGCCWRRLLPTPDAPVPIPVCNGGTLMRVEFVERRSILIKR